MKSLILLIALVSTSFANAFEWRGIKSGMTKEEVGKILLAEGINKATWDRATKGRFGVEIELGPVSYPTKLYDDYKRPVGLLSSIKLYVHKEYGLWKMVLRYAGRGGYEPVSNQAFLSVLEKHYGKKPIVGSLTTDYGTSATYGILFSDEKIVEKIFKEEAEQYSKWLKTGLSE
jgi:hypothetical protein